MVPFFQTIFQEIPKAKQKNTYLDTFALSQGGKAMGSSVYIHLGGPIYIYPAKLLHRIRKGGW
jgi:hypothetical protein